MASLRSPLPSANSTGKAEVTNAGSITTVGNNSAGIYASSGFGLSPQYAGLIGGFLKVPVFAATGSAVATTIVTNAGTITTYGSHSPGIVANAGAVASAGPSKASATVTVVNSGPVITVGSFSPAVSTTVFGDSSATILNNAGGILKSTGRPYTAISMNTYGGLLSNITNTVTNAAGGKIYGNIRSYGVATDTITNSGLWQMQGNTNLGTGVLDTNDLITNTATGVITLINHRRDLRSAGAGYHYGGGAVYGLGRRARFHTTYLFGVDTFNNAGLISMQDGDPDQQIVVSGNFVGQGGTLAVDAFLGGPPQFVRQGRRLVQVAPSQSDILTVTGTFSGYHSRDRA